MEDFTLPELVRHLAHDVPSGQLVDAVCKARPELAKEVVEAAVHSHQQHKHDAFIQFVEEDTRRILKEAATQALEEKARNEKAIEKIANEASLTINQLLADAKQEPAVVERIHKLDEAFSVDGIVRRLKKALGIALIEQLRDQLQHQVLEATNHFNHEGGELEAHVETLRTQVKQTIAGARDNVDFPREAVRNLVLEEIDQLEALYTDFESLAAKFKPYAK